MNEHIRQLLDQMAVLEEDLRKAAQEQENSVLFRIRGKRVEFEESVRQTHRRLKSGFFHWLVTYRPQTRCLAPTRAMHAFLSTATRLISKPDWKRPASVWAKHQPIKSS